MDDKPQVGVMLRLFTLDSVGYVYEGNGCMQLHEEEGEPAHLCFENHEGRGVIRLCRVCATPTCQEEMLPSGECRACDALPAVFSEQLRLWRVALQACIEEMGLARAQEVLHTPFYHRSR